MSSVLIVYGSTTGNTEFVADIVAGKLSAAGATVKKMNASDADASGLCDGYDMAIFGCSTWGDDSIELQDDFIPLFDSFESINASGKKTAVFGCGDSSYEYFCGAVDAIEQKLGELGATVIETLKIDGDPQTEKSEIEAWAGRVAAAL